MPVQVSDPRVRTRLPIERRWRNRYIIDGRVVDVVFVWMPAKRWARRPESTRAGWDTTAFGGFVLATRVDL